MQNNNPTKLILTLYLPVLISYVLINSPIISYFVAWFGSLFIFYTTILSPAAIIKTDLPIHKQIMRPIFLLQLIFAGFMCVTSVFYFMDHLGYRYLTEINYGSQFKENEQTMLIASCQRMSLLAHAALVTGMLLVQKNSIKIKSTKTFDSDDFLIWLGIIVFGIGSLTQRFPSLNQIAIPLTIVGISCAAVLFVKGVITKNVKYLGIGASIFIVNFLHASLSGYKEPIIINVIVITCVFFPYYKKLILYLAIPLVYILLYFLPTYNNTVRQSWSGEVSAEEAQNQAFENLDSKNKEQIEETNWSFLTRRLSEIEMFTQFVDYVPSHHSYYGWEIVENSLEGLIPRVVWTGKPNMETISMQRVYDAGVANPLSMVSAKTRPVVDAYLSFGIPGVFFLMLLYGMLVQHLSDKAEEIFGGYELGCVIMFNSIFQGLWRGNNFEFMFNNIFWGYVIMWFLFALLRTIKVLKPVFD
ncbi:exosortase Y-associated Wzy-like protein [Pedobacter sp. KACC 23697]|uniref:Oligosaccharide repeat unit polymerase n=1 Tax=Pedobacter sp. KACC 23697 TaxID=3149230 RepID=A0AAU7K742_9SPHI